MTTDLLTSLKTYLTKLSDGEKTPQEVAAAINAWARESADSLKSKIHDEVEATVLKMGFVKRDEFDRLLARVDAIAPEKKVPAKKNGAKKAAVKKAAVKKAAVKKDPAKKAVARKSGAKK
jgi:BMFP domain-containing protein YqiC